MIVFVVLEFNLYLKEYILADIQSMMMKYHWVRKNESIWSTSTNNRIDSTQYSSSYIFSYEININKQILTATSFVYLFYFKSNFILNI